MEAGIRPSSSWSGLSRPCRFGNRGAIPLGSRSAFRIGMPGTRPGMTREDHFAGPLDRNRPERSKRREPARRGIPSPVVPPTAVIPAQAGIHKHDGGRKGGTICASSRAVSGYGSRAPLTRPRDDTRASSLPLVGRARVGVLAPDLDRLSHTPPPPPPPHKGEESPSRTPPCPRRCPSQASLRWVGRRARRANLREAEPLPSRPETLARNVSMAVC
jgi:hypothetical protein